MRNAALLAFLLLLSLPISATAATSVQPSSANAPSPITHNDVSALPIDQPQRTTVTDHSLDVATAIDIHRSAAQTDLDRYALEHTMETASTEESRRNYLIRATADLETRVADLETTQRTLRTAYTNRSITTDTYLRQFARIHATQRHLHTYLTALESATAQVPDFTLRTRHGILSSQLVTSTGPLRDRVVSTTTGVTPTSQLFIAVSQNGTVIAIIQDTEYTREAYRADHRTSTAQDDFELDQAVSRVEELYPHAYNESIRTEIGLVADGLYRVNMELPQGTITAYLDGGSQHIVYEIQTLNLNQIGTKPGIEQTGNDTRLLVNTTYQGGPLRIATFDNETGSPVDATVQIDDRSIEIGPTGTKWILAPGQPQTTIIATRQTDSIRLTIPLEPPRIPSNGSAEP